MLIETFRRKPKFKQSSRAKPSLLRRLDQRNEQNKRRNPKTKASPKTQ